MDQDFDDFMAHRTDFMTEDQIYNLDRIINRLRMQNNRSNIVRTEQEQAADRFRHSQARALGKHDRRATWSCQVKTKMEMNFTTPALCYYVHVVQ